MVAFFDWPQAYEDQAERAVRAGLDAVNAANDSASFSAHSSVTDWNAGCTRLNGASGTNRNKMGVVPLSPLVASSVLTIPT